MFHRYIRQIGASVLLLAFCQAASAQLVHQYTFNDGTASDSVGTADGSVIGTAFVSDGALNLSGGGWGDGYVDLPNLIASDAAIGGDLGEISFETWVTANSTTNWAVIFSFGNSGPGAEDGNGSDGDYWQLIPRNGANGLLRTTTHVPGAETAADDSSVLATGQEVHLVNVIDSFNNTNVLYVNGVVAATTTLQAGFDPTTYGATGDTQNWLGRSQWADPGLDAEINEVRIYNTALNQAAVTASFNNGPVLDPRVVIQTTGDTYVTEDGLTDSYTINLNTVPAGAVQVTASGGAQTRVSLNNVTFSSSVSVSLTNTQPATIFVSGFNDAIVESTHTGTITHAITATADVANYPLSSTISSVNVIIGDNDLIPEVLVNLDIDDLSADGTTWANSGTIGGSFFAFNTPTMVADSGVDFAGSPVASALFDGVGAGQDGYVGPITAGSGIPVGDSNRSVEVWALNPEVAGDESLVGWGDRGTDGENWIVNYGTNPDFGALGAFGPADTGYGPMGAPIANQWHHVVMTYSASPQRIDIYVDGALYHSENNIGTVNTADTGTVNVAIQNNDELLAIDVAPLSGNINTARIYGDVLSASAVSQRFMDGPSGGGGLLGDVNCDGEVNLQDVQPFVNLLVSGGFSSKADINGDGEVNLSDVSPFVALLSGG